MTDSPAPSPDDAVPWHELPHNPVAFFGLQDGFGQKDLKRAYNRLIRKYKPEHSPAEFQQIRAAYERLDNQLRYGAGPSFGSLPAGVDWSQIFSAQPEAVAASRFESTDSSKSAESLQKQHQDYLSALMEEVRTSSPEAVFNRLNGKAEKSPFEYYALAVLSDTLPDRSTEKFVSHLLAGLAASPKDNGLRGMLYALFRQALTPAEIPTILLKTARVIRNDSFYSLTEPLWDILVRRYPFAKVRELLAQCEAQLRDFRIEAKLAFYLHLLRISMFRADREWIEQTVAFLEDSHSSLNSMNEYELDRLQLAWAYLQEREANPPKNELQQRMDKAIEQYFSDPEETRANGIYDCQVRIATSIEEVTKSFPFDVDDEKLSPFLQLWFSVSSDLEWRPRHLHRDASQTDRRIVWFLATLQAQTDQSRYGKTWDLVATLIHSYSAAGIFAVLVCAVSVFVLRLFIEPEAAFIVSLVIAILTAIVGHIYLIKPYWNRYCRKMAIKCYHALWRREVLQFVGQSQLSSDQFFYRARELRDTKMDYVTWTLNLVRVDDAVPLYATSQLFLK